MDNLFVAPIVLSLLALGAHFYRAGNLPLVLAVAAALGLLAVRRRWAGWALQLALVLGALEWLRTLAGLVAERVRSGEPFLRLAAILGGVVAFTLLSAWLVRGRAGRRHFGDEASSHEATAPIAAARAELPK